MHLISTDNELKTLARETPRLDKLALFSGGKGAFLNTKQSIKVNDPALHKSVTARHRCIKHLTNQLVKSSSSPRPHSISGLLWGCGPPGLSARVGLN